MISTITTATVTTLTTAGPAVVAGLSLLAILVLLALLIPKEVVSVSDRPGMRALSRALDVAIAPLLLAFVFIAVIKVMEVLR
jgi:thiosulfate reductase cytochrome b subunit